jgi:alpha-D-ribose 1-methylphosphonate 5-triphosphate synthase subunit PhnH
LTPRAEREQKTFRTLLNAMSRPGTVGRVEAHPAGGEAAAALTILEALVDHEVSLAVVPPSPTSEAVLRLTGSRVAPVSEADYVLCRESSLEEALHVVKVGPLEYPDRGATVICQVAEVGDGDPISLSGPGIEGSKLVKLRSFPASARDEFAERNAERPLGVDVIFVDEHGQVLCLNRYTEVREA